jgi:NAD(P) transhydrogenase subunit alpha
MIVGVPRETFAGERRVALVPAMVPNLVKAGLEVLVEAGAGKEAGFPDRLYAEKGAKLAADRGAVFAQADIILQVHAPGANPDGGAADIAALRRDQVVIGHHEPLTEFEPLRQLAHKGVTALSMELMPRITRAQSMDSLSSMATIAGYRAVLLAAEALPRLFPMLMTAAGTLAPARVFVVGVGVAGLQAIATARRLGAVVEAYDIRPAVADQVRSLGAKFVQFDLETAGAEDRGGYAREQSDEFIQRQQAEMAKVIAASDVVITTAAVPGKKAPILVTAAMVEGMGPGSVIVDLAAERGGNCELTQPGRTVVEHGVRIMGPLNMASDTPNHASQMYAKNITTFLLSLVKEGRLALDLADEVVQGTLLSRDGEIVHARVRELMGLPPAPAAAPAEDNRGEAS